MALIHKLIKVISAPVSLTHNFLVVPYKHWLTFRYAKVLQNILQDSAFLIPFVLYFGICCDTSMVGVLDFKYTIFPELVLPITDDFLNGRFLFTWKLLNLDSLWFSWSHHCERLTLCTMTLLTVTEYLVSQKTRPRRQDHDIWRWRCCLSTDKIMSGLNQWMGFQPYPLW